MIYGTEKLSELIENNSEMALLKKNIRGASIDLRIDNKAYIRNDTEPLTLTEDSNIDQLLEGRINEVDLAKGYFLKQNQYLYCKAFEKVVIPKNMCGLIVPRSTFARIGLILPISLFANPGYSGNLPIVIYNASPVSVEIPPFYRVAQILYCELNGEATGYHEQNDAKYHNEVNDARASLNDNEFQVKRMLSEQEIKKYLQGK